MIENGNIEVREFLSDFFKDSLVVNGFTRIPVKNIIDLYYKYQNIQSPVRDEIEKTYAILMKQQSEKRVNFIKKRAYIELPPDTGIVQFYKTL